MKKLLALAVLLAGSSLAWSADQAPAAAPAAVPAAANAADAAAAKPASNAVVKVVKLTLTTAIKDRKPADEAASFSASFPVYAWARFTVTNPPGTVKFVWSNDGKKVSEWSTDIKAEQWRTWASKKVWPGAWKVEIQDESGASLASADFTVTAEAKAADAAPAMKSDAAAANGAAPAPAAPAAGAAK